VEKYRGEYRAAMILLAINIGYPAVAGCLLRLLDERNQVDTPTLESFFRQLSPKVYYRDMDPPTDKIPDPADWGLAAGLSEYQEKSLSCVWRKIQTLMENTYCPEELEPYKKWAPNVGRYSFDWHLQYREER
jgi:hypothetical protein